MHSVCLENDTGAGAKARAEMGRYEPLASFANPLHPIHAMGEDEVNLKEDEYRVPWQHQMVQQGPVHVAMPKHRPDISYVTHRPRYQKVSLCLRLSVLDLIGTEDQPQVNDRHELLIRASDVMPFRCPNASHHHQHYIMAMVVTSAHTAYFPEAARMEVDVVSKASPVGSHNRPAEAKTWIRDRVADLHNKKEPGQARFLGFLLGARTQLSKPEYWFTAPDGTATRHFHMLECLRDGVQTQVKSKGQGQVLVPAGLTASGVPSNMVAAMVLREWKSYQTQGRPTAALTTRQLPRVDAEEAALVLGAEELHTITSRVAEMLHVGSGLWQDDLRVQFKLLDFSETWQPMLEKRRHTGCADISVHLELALFTVVLG